MHIFGNIKTELIYVSNKYCGFPNNEDLIWHIVSFSILVRAACTVKYLREVLYNNIYLVRNIEMLKVKNPNATHRFFRVSCTYLLIFWSSRLFLWKFCIILWNYLAPFGDFVLNSLRPIEVTIYRWHKFVRDDEEH